MKEYIDYTADVSLAKELLPKLESIIDEFLANTENGLAKTFGGKQNWNFYDWSEYLVGALDRDEASQPDLVINSLFVMALDSLEHICLAIGEPFNYGGVAERVRERIREEFASDGALLSHRKGSKEYTELGNSLAILCGAINGKDAAAICEQMVSGGVVSPSLSMNIWRYEALLLTDEKKYRDLILNEIRANYKKMLDAGSTTVWETVNGSSDFDNAGSLCHGWSAVPIYVYHRLGIAKRIDI